MRDFSANTPPEVLRIVLTHLLSDPALKHARLLNKQWSAVAATLLWRQVHIDLSGADHRKFDALLNSCPNGILDNVRRLRVSSTLTTSCLMQKQLVTSSLLKLLSALPRDCLSSFRSKTFPIHPDAICVLLRTQSRLHEIEAVVDETSPDGLPGASHARGNLMSLEKIKLDVTGSKHHTYQGVGGWFAYAPKLKEMTVKGRGLGPNWFHGWLLPPRSTTINLSRLAMENVHLTNESANLVGHLHLPSLKVLELTDCASAAPFLQTLANMYKYAEHMALGSFSHNANCMLKDVQEATAEFIRCTRGLKQVALGDMTGAVMGLECLEAHGSSLTVLQLSCTAEDAVYYSAEDLRQLKSICPNLDVLSIDLGDLSLVIDELGIGDPFRLLEHTEYIEKLKVIAQHSSIRTLCIADPPLLYLDSPANERRWRYTEVASQIFQHLADYDSRVRVLEFSPLSFEDNGVEEDKDEDGHSWPRYAFERGTVTVNRDGRWQDTQTIAVPSPQKVSKVVMV